MKIIGLDVGEKRIGVARADSATRIAVPVGFVTVNGSEWQEIARIASLAGTNWFVLGLPRSNEGNETKQTLYVRQFAKTLSEKIPGARVRFQDESLTSVEAERRLKSRKKSYNRGDIDAEAASIILQDFIEGLKQGDTAPAASIPVSAAPDKVALEAKKIKHKSKKWLFGVVPLVVIALGALAVVGVQHWRNAKARERAEYYAYLESQMKAEVFDFTILPGETIFDVRAKLIKQGYSEAEADEALNYNYDFGFLQGRPEGATLEGYLYGETYEFYEDSTATDIIRKFLEGMDKIISDNNLEARYAARGLSLYEGITLASIVQKEAAPRDQATVAQVFFSRMALGMSLGSDVTVSYALDKIDPLRQTYADNQAALDVDSCYNTRKYRGLPCGPISNPSLSALVAVAEPTDTDYLFFLTGDDGMMYYSNTEYEHNQNAAAHCKELCQVSL